MRIYLIKKPQICQINMSIRNDNRRKKERHKWGSQGNGVQRGGGLWLMIELRVGLNVDETPKETEPKREKKDHNKVWEQLVAENRPFGQETSL